MLSPRIRVIPVALAASLIMAGCAAYTPVGVSVAPAAATVRLSLTNAARSESIGSLGSQIVTLEGKVRSVSDSTVSVTVTEVGRFAGDNESVRGQTVVVPVRLIDRAERKKFLVGRSLLLAGAVTGAAIWLGLQAGHGSVSLGRPTSPSTPGQ
jgi:hypothetical protein